MMYLNFICLLIFLSDTFSSISRSDVLKLYLSFNFFFIRCFPISPEVMYLNFIYLLNFLSDMFSNISRSDVLKIIFLFFFSFLSDTFSNELSPEVMYLKFICLFFYPICFPINYLPK